jgi:hypothetical protein
VSLTTSCAIWFRYTFGYRCCVFRVTVRRAIFGFAAFHDTPTHSCNVSRLKSYRRRTEQLIREASAVLSGVVLCGLVRLHIWLQVALRPSIYADRDLRNKDR